MIKLKTQVSPVSNEADEVYCYSKWVFYYENDTCVKALHFGYDTREGDAKMSVRDCGDKVADAIELATGIRPKVKHDEEVGL